MEGLSETHLRYLLAIYELSQATPDVGAAAVAKAMNVTKPSVTSMLNALMEKKLLVRERYGKIYLTGSGFITAKKFKQYVRQLEIRIPKMGLRLGDEDQYNLACILAASLPEHTLGQLNDE